MEITAYLYFYVVSTLTSFMRSLSQPISALLEIRHYASSQSDVNLMH